MKDDDDDFNVFELAKELEHLSDEALKEVLYLRYFRDKVYQKEKTNVVEFKLK